MARPGMTDETPDDAAPESGRLDLDPGRNVGTAQLGASPAAVPLGDRPSQPQLDTAQAEARREASPESYQTAEKVDDRRPGAGLLLIGGAVVIILIALLVFLT